MRFSRPTTNGFTLLEAVAAVAAIAIVSIPLASAMTSNLQNQKKLTTQIAEREFAFSMIEKIDAERALWNAQGTYKDRFKYDIALHPIPSPVVNKFSALIEHVEITVHIDDLTGPGNGYTLTRIFTRRPKE